MTGKGPVRVALVGTRGYGRVHLQNLERLTAAGAAQLIGVVDITEPAPETRGLWHRDLASLLEAHAPAPPEVVIIATPIDTHVPLAQQALAAGCHVYLEKPPVPALSDHWLLLEVAETAGRSVQVGFQSRGGAGVDALRAQRADGVLGEVDAVRVHGAWTRDRAYYRRSPWAGRRRLDGRRVADGVATNPLAHGIHAGLVIAGIDRIEGIASITTELRRAHDIEADDTTFVRIDPAGPGPSVLCALTTTAPEQSPPWVEISGPGGTERLSYTQDISWHTDPGGAVSERSYSRTDLVENLLAHVRDPQARLLSPLRASGVFSAVLEAIQSAPDPTVIDPEHVTWIGEGEAAHPVVDDIHAALRTALETGQPFSRNGVSWTCEDAISTWRPASTASTAGNAGPTANAAAPTPQAPSGPATTPKETA
ncbi:MAG: Gfo/Idh/MocA family protein [Dermabacteraceae bacterium]